MKITSGTKGSTITLLLILAISALMTCLPTATAADITTYPFLTVVPSTVGVGQQVQITMWLSMPPPTILEELTGGIGGGEMWHNYTVTVTKPGGTTQILGPFNAESTGSTYTLYKPDVVGNYSFVFNFPGERKNGTELFTFKYIDDYFKPSTSPTVSITVQEDPIPGYPNWPLPTGYWYRPIESENRDWWSISGNWLLERYNSQANLYAPYTKGPNTAHIVWTKELAFGGVTGGEFSSRSYHEGHVYTNKFAPPVVINGKIFYNQPDPPKQGFYCVDLRTGEEIYYSNSSSNPTGGGFFWQSSGGTGGITCGQLLDFNSINEHGLHAYLWSLSSTYTMYDSFTGNKILDFNNVLPGAAYETASFGGAPSVSFDEKGNLLVYLLDGTNNWLALWNSTKAIYPLGTDNFRPVPGTYDWRNGIQWNVTVPDIPGVQGWMTDNPGPAAITDDIALATTWSFFTGAFDGVITDVAYSAKDGHQLWVQNRSVIPGATSFAARGPISDGVYCRFIKETMQWYAYDLSTGNLKWGPTEAYTNGWGMYSQASATAAYGVLYSAAYDGMIHAYNITNGAHLWDYWTGNAGYETPYGTWPFYGLASGTTVADGKVYTGTCEHSADVPLWRGGGLYCVNATSGDLVWKVLGWYFTPVIADGYMVINNGADNRLYCFGKGQTATTVDAPNTAVTVGQNMVIRGTVTDQSSGAKGTAAIADAYQSPWMEYLYMQKPMPTNATGVTVSLDVFDANGNFRNIGTTTSDADGCYSFVWKPDIPGKYTVYATFAGSESYWQSHAETAFVAEEAVVEPTPQYPQPIDNTITIVYGVIAILIAIIVGFVALALLQRKR